MKSDRIAGDRIDGLSGPEEAAKRINITPSDLSSAMNIPDYSEGGVYFDNQFRTDSPVSAGSIDNPINKGFYRRRFALSGKGIEHLAAKNGAHLDLQASLGSRLGVAKRFIAETGERGAIGLYGKNNLLSNEMVKLDNYEFVLGNTPQIQSNLARLILAMMEHDRDMNEIFKDFFDEGGKWQSSEPDTIINEAMNRLKKTEERNKPKYRLLLSMYDRFSDIQAKQEEYSLARAADLQKRVSDAALRARENIFGLEHGSATDVSGLEYNEKIQKLKAAMNAYVRIMNRFTDNADHVSREEALRRSVMSVSAESALQVFNDFSANNPPDSRRTKEFNEDLEKIREAERAILDLGGGEYGFPEMYNLGGVSIGDSLKYIEYHESLEQDLPDLSNDIMELSTTGLKKLLERTDALPSEIILKIIDERYAEEIGEGRNDDIEKGIVSLIEASLPPALYSKLDSESQRKMVEDARKEFIESIRRNSDEIRRSVLKQDNELDVMKQHSPFNMSIKDSSHSFSLEILRDAAYVSAMVAAGDGAIKSVFGDTSVSNKIIMSSLDQVLKEKKPDVGEVSDLFNGYLLLQKGATASVSDEEVEEIANSEIFLDNAHFKKEDIAVLRDIAEGLSDDASLANEEEMFGDIEEDDLRYAHYGLGYFAFGESIHKKLDPAKNALLYLVSANHAMSQFTDCMQGAKNPRTNVETPASLAKGCIDKFEQDLNSRVEKGFDDLTKGSNAFAAVNPMGFLQLLAIIIAQAQSWDVKRLTYLLDKRINEQMDYVMSAETLPGKLSRRILLDIETKGSGGGFVEEGGAIKIQNTTEAEATSLDIINGSKVKGESARLNGSLVSEYTDNSTLLHEKERINSQLSDIKDEALRHKAEIEKQGDLARESDLALFKEQEENRRIRVEELQAELSRLDEGEEKTKGNEFLKKLSSSSVGGVLAGASIQEMSKILHALKGYRESLYEQIIDNGGNSRKISLELERIKDISNTVLVELVTSNETALQVTDDIVRDYTRSGVKDDTKDIILKEGLSVAALEKITNDLQGDASLTAEAKRLTIENIQRAARNMNSTREGFMLNTLSSKDANTVNKVVQQAVSASRTIKDAAFKTNELYTVADDPVNGKVFISANVGAQGYFMSKISEMERTSHIKNANRYISAMKQDGVASKGMREYLAKKEKSISQANRSAFVSHNMSSQSGMSSPSRLKVK